MIRTYVTANLVTANRVTGGLAPFYNAVTEGLIRAAKAADLTLDLRLIRDESLDPGRMDRDDEIELAAGTLLVGIDPTPRIVERLQNNRRVVLVNTFDPEMRFDCVGPNNFYGSAMAARMLLHAGHRSLLHVRDHRRPTTCARPRCSGNSALISQGPPPQAQGAACWTPAARQRPPCRQRCRSARPD